jgi:hypothetical protein
MKNPNYVSLTEKLKALQANRESIQKDMDFYVATLQANLQGATGPHKARIQDDIKRAKKLYTPDLEQLDFEISLLQNAIREIDGRVDGLAPETKDYAMQSWVRAGGDPNKFEEAWPAILQDIEYGSDDDDDGNEGDGEDESLAGHRALISQHWGPSGLAGKPADRERKPQKAEW